MSYTPIRFIHRSICKKDLAALCAILDICLVTPIRDGVNLVSYVHVACKQGRSGALTISKHADVGTLKDADEVAQTMGARWIWMRTSRSRGSRFHSRP
jgi:trehalose-6-phosphate synthase